MYLELGGNLGPQSQSQPHTSAPSHDRNSLPWKTLVPKKVEKKKKAKAPVKSKSDCTAYAFEPNP